MHPPWPACPNCFLQARPRLVLTVRNLFWIMINDMFTRTVGFPEFDVLYRCRGCGRVYGLHEVRKRSTACPRCNYNLLGNVSGTCPECGRSISGRLRKRIAQETQRMDLPPRGRE